MNSEPDTSTGAPPEADAPKPAPAEATSAEAPNAESTPNAIADAQSQPADTRAEGGDGPVEAADDAGPDEEGDDAPADAAGASASGETPKKKRRRRRRKKAPGADAAVAGATSEAGEPSAAGDGEAPTDGARAKPEGRPDKGAKKDNKKKKPRGEKAAPPHERPAFHVGEEVFGKVTSVTEHAIMVDLSGKALGIFDRHELAADDLVPEVGDRFVAHVHGDGSRGGLVVLTRKPLREEEAKPKAEEAAKAGTTVLGLVTGVVKGGVEVDVDGLRAFAPASHMDLRPGADLAHLIGQRLEFQVAEYAKRGRDVVVSRKQFLESEAKEARQASLAKLEAGSIVKGVVRTVVAYGAFVAIPSADDVEGLVHMTEASHDRGAKLSEVFKPGAEIDVKVLKVDEKGKLWLSHKQAIPDPWAEMRSKYAEGSRHKGKIVRLQPFGVFIELEPGVDGLLHTSDLSHKPIEHPKDVVKLGDEIDVVVASMDEGGRRIKLHPAPPPGEENEPRQKVAPHKTVRVAVVSAESAGLVVRILGSTGRQARGFIPAGHTGTDRGTDLRKHFPPGTKLEAKVIDIDPRRGEPKLSLRALKEDVEKAAYNEYRASVAKASKFGTLGDLLAKKGIAG